MKGKYVFCGDYVGNVYLASITCWRSWPIGLRPSSAVKMRLGISNSTSGSFLRSLSSSVSSSCVC
jgi:hypothetical protein